MKGAMHGTGREAGWKPRHPHAMTASEAGVVVAGSLLPDLQVRAPAATTRAPDPPGADGASPVFSASDLPDTTGGGGVREEPAAAFSGARRRRRGSPAPNRADRAGTRLGDLTCLAYVRTDKGRRAVWRCRCECGRPGCLLEVERNVEQLRRLWPSCRWPQPKPPVVAKVRGRPARMLLPEGVRQPWSRTAGKRASRDERLLAAFAAAGPR
jgi:hypothetical protein